MKHVPYINILKESQNYNREQLKSSCKWRRQGPRPGSRYSPPPPPPPTSLGDIYLESVE